MLSPKSLSALALAVSLFSGSASAAVELVAYPTTFKTVSTASYHANYTAHAAFKTASPSTGASSTALVQLADVAAVDLIPVAYPSASYGNGDASLGLAFVPQGDNLSPGLSQLLTNGESLWGQIDCPRIPKALKGPTSHGSVWANATATDTNYYQELPDTGVVRCYNFTISKSVIAPDGVEKQALLVNNAFPGPLIEANWGDWIEVTVNNALDDEGTGLHWHGLLQKDTPYFDGVMSVSQCPVAPGHSFTYKFRADLYGTSWYHSHYSAQYVGGALGPMIIHGPIPTGVTYDEDLGPILLTDWYHKDYFDLVEDVMAPASAGKPPPASNNSLINGKMNYPCSALASDEPCTPNAGLAKFRFQSGKVYRARLIAATADAIIKFSLDNHNFTVIANDFVEVEPYETNVITLGVGQRTDVLIHATGSPGDSVWMRSNISMKCSVADGISPGGLAVVYYEDADSDSIPQTTSSVTEEQMNFCANDDLALTKPIMPMAAVNVEPAATEDIVISFGPNATGHNVWMMNKKQFRANFNEPILLDAHLGRTQYPEEWAVHNFGSNETVRLIYYNTFQFSAHPMHLHGHNMQVVAEGFGTWDGHVTNAHNPQRRDVQILQAAKDADTPAYLVVQWVQDNPGVWPNHCHIAWHASGGLYMNILERPIDIVEREIPRKMAETCRNWWAWSHANVVPQIDSGM